MNRISYNLTTIIDALESPIQTVNRTAFEIARNFEPTPNQVKHNFISKAAPTVPWAENFKNVHDNQDLLNDSLNADFEHLVKVLVPKGLEKEQSITLQTNSGPAQYVVYKKIATEGLVSYALKSLNPDHPPLLVFRCTEKNPQKEHCFHSMQNDTDDHIGERGWEKARKTFIELMGDREFRAPGQKIKVGGYSLGGAHAQYFVAEHHARVSHACFFNNPSINPKVVESFAKNIQGPIILQIFRNWGDPFTHFGGKHLGCGVTHPNVQVQLLEISTPNCDRFDTDLHSKCIFKTKNYDYTVESFTDPDVLAKKLDNSKRDCATKKMEAIRQKSGGFLSFALGALSSMKTSLLTLMEEEARLKKKSRNI